LEDFFMRATRSGLVLGLFVSFSVIAIAVGEGCSSDSGTAAGAGGTGGTSAGGAGTGGAIAGGGAGGGPSSLTLTIAPLGTATAMGTAVFEKVSGNQIKLTVDVNNVMPISAPHGIHIHANPDCGTSSDGDGGTVTGGAAGGHWNPDGHEHGSSVASNHLGDIGNIAVDARGLGTLTFMTEHWTMGTGAANDILNHALILHAGTDDGATQPTGNAGGRIGCVVIR
jgi:superoxide dismutase, Cu-Zn family